MRHTTGQKLGHIGRVIIAWFIAYAFFMILRMYGIDDMPGIEVTRPWSSGNLFIQLLVASAATGLLYGLTDLLLDRPQTQRLAYWKILTFKTALNLVIIMVVLALLVLSGVQLGVIDLENIRAAQTGEIAFSRPAFVFILYFLIIDIMLSLYQQVKQKYGRGVFVDMLIGRYHKPKEADRIFMFIDLKSSVTIAEKLGHFNYSYLLQDCYFDLNTLLSRYKARVYQYVGDEAVLYWNLEDGLKDNNCIRMFFGFINKLDRKAAYYQERYGLQPFFKASAHVGRVTVAEVGLLKRDIAFHGDTVNTTARILSQCNALNQRFLVSRELLERLPDRSKVEFEYIGSEVLRGKYNSMEIYGVHNVQNM